MKKEVLHVALLGAVVCGALACACTVIACPHVKAKTITCDSGEPDLGGCAGGPIACNKDHWSQASEVPLESEENPGEDTKTVVKQKEQDKVVCYQAGGCIWTPAVPFVTPAKCRKQLILLGPPVTVSPLETKPC